jgi:hypothetical protein
MPAKPRDHYDPLGVRRQYPSSQAHHPDTAEDVLHHVRRILATPEGESICKHVERLMVMLRI